MRCLNILPNHVGSDFHWFCSQRRLTEKRILLLALLSALTCLAPGPTAAQDLDNVTIAGRVADQNGAVIPGATVTATLVKTKIERTMVADGDGHYKLIQLEPGVYNVKASFTNFAAEEKTDLTTVAGQNVQLDFTLKPATVTAEAVVVSAAENPQVDTTRTVVGGTVATREIESLPLNSRSPLDLIFTLGGVAEEPLSTRDIANDRTSSRSTPEEAGVFSLSGGTAYSNNITIDGLDNNDDRAARERFTPSIEAIDEVQIIRNQFAAEYGRASGGRVNLRTRGGSNKFRGRGYYFFRDESLNANTWKNNSLGLKRLPLQEQDPGFTLSGPIVIPKLFNGHDRTFFFTAYEYDTLLDSTLINTLVPVQQNPLFPLPAPTTLSGQRLENASSPAISATVAPFITGVSTPQRNHIFTTRVDHTFTDLHNGSFVFQLGRLNNLRQFGGGNRLAQALEGKTRNTDAISYSDNYVFSAKAVAQTRFQFSRLTPAVEATGGTTTPVVLIGINDPLKLVSGTLVAGTSTSGATNRRETRFQVQEIFSYVHGPHSLKFGGDIQRIKSTFIDLSDATGTWDFDSAGDFLLNTPSRFRQNFLTTSTQHNTYIGIFAQDEWRLKPNLTFSYGVRWEDENILRDLNNFGPRVAFAYDPFKSGKTVIRGGAGIFYNRVLLRTIDDFTFGNQQLFLDTDALVDTTTGKVLTDAQRRAFIAANLHFPQTLTADSALVKQFGVRNTGTGGSSGGVLRRLDPDLRIPESYQANVGFERQIGRNMVFEANYTWNRGLHLWREFNVNAPALPKGYKNFTTYLASHDFANFLNVPGGVRPLLNTSTAGDLVRFVLVPPDPANPNSVVRIVEFGVPISLVNLNSTTSTTSVNTALAALNPFRPDPSKGEVEQLIPVGNSFYHGLVIEVRNRFRQGKNGASVSFRAVYTLSFLTDDGIVNTSDALIAGDFRSERSRSLQDRRHRFAFSATIDTPKSLARLRISPVLRIASSAPFNIGLGGADRNLDDIGNDRPFFNGDPSTLVWRRPGQTIDASILNQFTQPTIGQTGDLPRNAGAGPGQFIFDLSVSREFKLSDKVRLRPVVEFNNVMNKTVFSFGSEFIDFSSFSPTSSAASRQSFLDSFLVPTRTMRPREIRLGMRLDF
ncbi:MAG TPA: carboxypeptidase regulatory-like domain-containing protein [Pyrinomonadaceae bacterium]|nr:carboxypeptidase regulatory-like domain-containing protein [Pyrinomonadaceae bacterium]